MRHRRWYIFVIIGALGFRNEFDGHTLDRAIEQVEVIFLALFGAGTFVHKKAICHNGSR